MKRLTVALSSASFLVLAASAAFAQDGEYDWTGGYAGVQLAFSNFSTTISDVDNQFSNNSPTQSMTLGSGGVFGGYNWNLRGDTDILLGFELDYTSALVIEEFFSTNVSRTTGVQYNNEITNITSLNARVGMPNGRMLAYFSGGVSQAQIKMETYQVDRGAGRTNCGNSTCAKTTEALLGLNFGVGMDYAYRDNIIARFGVQHYMFDSVQADVTAPAGGSACSTGATGSCTVGYAPSVTQIRIGVSYAF